MSDTKQNPSTDDTECLSIKELWKLLDNWLKTNNPKAYESLNPPITPEELKEFETAVQTKLPEDYKESLLIHNGTTDEYIPMFGGYSYCDHEGAIGIWEWSYEEEDTHEIPEIRQFWWSKKWIPFAYNDQTLTCCLDMDPTPMGTKGQAIAITIGGDLVLLGKSFKEFFAKYVKDVYDGKYDVYSDGGMLMSVDKLYRGYT
ncbi:unnamed protein product [Ambrosiozyma monospora]|uniref:Unnamed protein product n=1 Tax=Ambrosiozyma monospora TaxID=43982 RepID=A0ACB5SV90_AMBMO|nr:unnamed protein product [Ambrosiozyma monospora]